MLNHIDEQALDVRAIVVLICHDHDAAIAQTFDGVVILLWLKTHDFDDVLNLLVVHCLLETSISDLRNQKFETYMIAVYCSSLCGVVKCAMN